MNFTPQTKEQIKESKLIPDGVYPFQVHAATEGRSKKGQDMISLELYVWDDKNAQRTLRDWLGTWDFGIEKICGFCEAIGRLDIYSGGGLTARECVDAQGYLVIGSKENGEYGPQNFVKFYVPQGEQDGTKARLARAPKPLPEQKYYKPAAETGDATHLDNDLPF